jgi:transcription elongation GreA/GreB family factor
MPRRREHHNDADHVRRLEERLRLYAEQIPPLTLFSEETRRRLKVRLAKEIGLEQPDQDPTRE